MLAAKSKGQNTIPRMQTNIIGRPINRSVNELNGTLATVNATMMHAITIDA